MSQCIVLIEALEQGREFAVPPFSGALAGDMLGYSF